MHLFSRWSFIDRVAHSLRCWVEVGTEMSVRLTYMYLPAAESLVGGAEIVPLPVDSFLTRAGSKR
jgi:hypothetical protein